MKPCSHARGASAALAACLAALFSFSTASMADEHRGPEHGRGVEHRPGFRAPGPWRGDIHRFYEHDWGVWRGGHWIHGPHNGRLGWWWVAGGLWYFYPVPVYPYPSPWEPPAADLVTPAPNSPPPPTQVWYWCDSAQQYYPYVATCPGGWRQVPATPVEPPR
jgi:hypothetical protein